MIVRSINTYPHIKALCRFFNSLRNTVELRDDETLAVTSGKFSGLTFAFETGLCNVSTCNSSISFDLNADLSADALIRVVARHCMIKDTEMDDHSTTH